MRAPDLELTAAERIAEHRGDPDYLRDDQADKVANENRAANVGRWTSWSERAGSIPPGTPICGAR